MGSRTGTSRVLLWCVIAASSLGYINAQGFEEAALIGILKEVPYVLKEILRMWDNVGKTATRVLWCHFTYSPNMSVYT
jgi:hypothetical protein